MSRGRPGGPASARLGPPDVASPDGVSAFAPPPADSARAVVGALAQRRGRLARRFPRACLSCGAERVAAVLSLGRSLYVSSPSPTFSKSNHARAQPPSSQPTEIGSGLACGEESTAPPGSLSREPALKPPSYSPSSGSAQLQAPHASVAQDELQEQGFQREQLLTEKMTPLASMPALQGVFRSMLSVKPDERKDATSLLQSSVFTGQVTMTGIKAAQGDLVERMEQLSEASEALSLIHISEPTRRRGIS